MFSVWQATVNLLLQEEAELKREIEEAQAALEKEEAQIKYLEEQADVRSWWSARRRLQVSAACSP